MHLLFLLVVEVGFESPTRKYSRLGRVRVARVRGSLFSPLSRSLPLAPRALALQAHSLPVGRGRAKHTVAKRKATHQGCFSFCARAIKKIFSGKCLGDLRDKII